MSNVIRPTVWEDRATADLIEFIASIDPATVEMIVVSNVHSIMATGASGRAASTPGFYVVDGAYNVGLWIPPDLATNGFAVRSLETRLGRYAGREAAFAAAALLGTHFEKPVVDWTSDAPAPSASGDAA
jgi:hypothetical protein